MNFAGFFDVGGMESHLGCGFCCGCSAYAVSLKHLSWAPVLLVIHSPKLAWKPISPVLEGL